MPAALYDICRAGGFDPIRVTSKVIMPTSRQTKDYLLCSPCEGLLNRGGENWVLPKLATWDKGFPLYEMLQQIQPDVVDNDVRGYAAVRHPDINVHAITHFAMGIFWKASVYSWLGGVKEPRIELGPYAEAVRRFLRNETGFPQHMILNVGIVPPEVRFIQFLDPYRGSGKGQHNFLFNVPGVHFSLRVGKTFTDEDRGTCFYADKFHPIVVTRRMADDMKRMYREQSKKAHKSRKLVELLKKRNVRN